MKKIIAMTTIILMLVAALSGCVQQPIVSPSPEKSAELTATPELSVQPSPEMLPEEPTQPEINIDENQISKFFNMNKDEIIQLLGNNYEIVQTGGEGTYDGYEYKELGLTFIFDDDKVWWIEPSYEYSDDNYSPKLYQIYGLTADMNFQQIEDTLGKNGKISEGLAEDGDTKIYFFDIKMDNYTLSFDGSKYGIGGTKIMCYANR